jgi:hypothetical protein
MKFDPETAKPGDVYKSPRHDPGDTVWVFINKRNCVTVDRKGRIRPDTLGPPSWYVFSHNIHDELICLTNPNRTPSNAATA